MSQLLIQQYLNQLATLKRVAGTTRESVVRANGETTPCPSAPEICVEVRSPQSSDAEIAAKTSAYLAAGAREVWVVEDSGAIRYFDSAGEKPASLYPLSISLPPRLDR